MADFITAKPTTVNTVVSGPKGLINSGNPGGTKAAEAVLIHSPQGGVKEILHPFIIFL